MTTYKVTLRIVTYYDDEFVREYIIEVADIKDAMLEIEANFNKDTFFEYIKIEKIS